MVSASARPLHSIPLTSETPPLLVRNVFHSWFPLSKANGFCNALDELEKKPLVFSSSSSPSSYLPPPAFQNKINEGKQIRLLLTQSRSQQAKRALDEIDRRIISLKYRIESWNGGLNPLSAEQVNSDLAQQIESIALAWKNKQNILAAKDLSTSDRLKILEVCTYPEFATLLLNDKILQKNFFSWILRDKCPVRPFIEFPATSARLRSAHLAVRIGRFGGDVFQVTKKDNTKFLTLPFITNRGIQQINILNDSQDVVLNGNLKLTIQQVIEVFGKKNEEIGDLEFSSEGIMNWNSHFLGPKDPSANDYKSISLANPTWWEDLPLFQKLSKVEVEQRCGESLAEGQWVALAKGSRQTKDLDFTKRHGYLEVFIPINENEYRLFPFGKFAQTYPLTDFQNLAFMLNTVSSRLAFPDENVFYTHREHAGFAVKLDPDEGAYLMSLIKKDLIHSRMGNLYFQFACENCGYWVQSLLNKVKPIPNLFKLYLLDSRPSNPIIGGLFSIYRLLPQKCQSAMIAMTDYLLGSWRGIDIIENGKRVFKSVYTHPMRQEQSIYQVGYLHEQIRTGKLKGVIDNGF